MIYWSLRSTRRDDPPQNIHLHRRIRRTSARASVTLERRFRQWKKQRVVLVATGNLSLDYWRPSGESETTFSDDHHDAAAVVLQKSGPKNTATRRSSRIQPASPPE
jgi:hypothetical protein